MRTFSAAGRLARPDGGPGWRRAGRDPQARRPAGRVLPLVALLVLAGAAPARAQVLETFVGHERVTEDVMFFKFFMKPAPPGEAPAPSDVLFFFRARAAVDYAMAGTSTLPQFGLTSAVSYNPQVLRGFAPVFVVQLFNRGAFAKAGVQYARTSRRTTVFSWVVCETDRRPVVDVFVLARYVHPLTGATGIVLQAESVNGLPTVSAGQYSFTQRVRVGLQLQRWQFGPGLDVTRTGRTTYSTTTNAGLFARYDF
jgi:hypothetical protein